MSKFYSSTNKTAEIINRDDFGEKALEILWKHFGADRTKNPFDHGFLDFKAENEWPLQVYDGKMYFYPRFRKEQNFDYMSAASSMEKSFLNELGLKVRVDMSRAQKDLDECGYIHMDTPCWIEILDS